MSGAGMATKTAVLIPAFNESKTIAEVIERIPTGLSTNLNRMCCLRRSPSIKGLR
jgi:hypothetical protein